MTSLETELANLTVEVTSPDRGVAATVDQRGRQVEVRFSPGAYGWYDEATLAHQMAQLATLAWTGFQRRRRELLEARNQGLANDETSAPGSEQETYRSRLEQLIEEGGNDDGAIRLRSRALVRWHVSIADGTLQRLSEEEFISELNIALHRLLAHHRDQVILLKEEVFGLGIPRDLLRAKNTRYPDA